MKHIHIKHSHINIYRCPVCSSATSNANVYKKHTQKHIDRRNINNVEHIDVQPNNLNTIVPSIAVDNVVVPNENQIEPIHLAIDLDNYIEEIKKGSCRYILNLVSSSNMTMMKTLKTINLTGYFLSPIYNFIANNIDNIKCIGDKTEFLSLCENPFKYINTEYKLIKYLKLNSLYVKPSKYVLKTSTKLKTRKGISVLENVNDTVVYMSIYFMIQKFLELPNVYKKMSEKMKRLMENNTYISHFVQGEKWRKIVRENPGKNLIPIFLYNDDFATGNQQGIKASNHGVSVVNMHFPLMEDWELSKLEFLFPIAFVEASHTKSGNKTTCLIKLRNILKTLAEDGIKINLLGEEITVHIILGTIIGDNLAVHQMLDMTTGFMHEFMCRVCLMDKNTRKTAVVEDKRLIRTIEHYNFNKNNSKLGYNRVCPFNLIPNFHVIENYSADIMHDVFEGIAVYGMQAALDTLIREGFFTAAEFSNLLDTFSYGVIDSNNKLSSDNFKNGKLYLTASQSILLVKYLPVLISHRVPHNNSTYKYTIILERLCNMCFSKKFDNEKIKDFEQLIKKHHSMYLKFKEIKIDKETNEEILVNVTLKPKHHFILHYLLIILLCGPLIHMWSMRHEGLNKYMKMYTDVSTSRVNLSLSLAKKFQIMFASFLDKYNNQVVKEITYSISKPFDLLSKTYNGKIDFPFNIKNVSTSYNRIEYRGTEYKINYYIYASGMACKIIDIVSTVSNNFFVILEKFDSQKEENHNYYKLGKTTNTYSLRSICYLGIPFNIITLLNRTKIFKFNEYRIEYI